MGQKSAKRKTAPFPCSNNSTREECGTSQHDATFAPLSFFSPPRYALSCAPPHLPPHQRPHLFCAPSAGPRLHSSRSLTPARPIASPVQERETVFSLSLALSPASFVSPARGFRPTSGNRFPSALLARAASGVSVFAPCRSSSPRAIGGGLPLAIEVLGCRIARRGFWRV